MMRRYLKHFFLAGLITGALIPALNWLIDPYEIYDSPSIDIFNTHKPAIAPNERIYKTLGLAEKKSEIIFLGTSRTDIGLDPKHPAFSGKKVLNLGISSQPYEESRLLFEKFSDNADLETVVIGVDFFAANTYLKAPANFTIDDYSAFRKLKLATTISTLKDSIKTALGRNEGDGNRWTKEGRRIYSDMPIVIGGNREFFHRNVKSYTANTYLPEPQCAFAFTDNSGSTPLNNVRQILAKAYRENLDLRLFISPSHAWQWETVAAAGLWEQWEEWKRKLIELNEGEAAKAGKPPFPLWDFTGYNSITNETIPPLNDVTVFMKNYYDASHYTPEIGNLVLDRVFDFHDPSRKIPNDFGVRISSENIENHLARIRKEQSAYRSSHPDDISEIEKLSEEVKSKKHCLVSR